MIKTPKLKKLIVVLFFFLQFVLQIYLLGERIA